MPRREKRIEEILREALAVVAAARIPEDLRSVAFGKAVDLILGVSTTSQADTTVEQRSRLPRQEQGSTGTPLEMISRKFETEIEVINEAFAVEDAVPQLTIPRSKLAKSKRAATKQIALLVAAARQAAGVEDWTESKTIRESAEVYGKYDPPNFAAAILELEDEFSFSGKGKTRRVKVRRDGFKAAGALVTQLLGKSEG